jgi:hypothetical protein
MRLARLLSITLGLDCLVLFFWFAAGSLSVIRYYVEITQSFADALLVPCLFAALIAFGARIVVRAYTRAIINRL